MHQNLDILINMQYLPFGELFVNQQNSTYDTRYKFSAKELDDETQYSYFGARYYDSDLSVWLSVDPLSDKYPSMSPYMYTAGNPIRLIDPNGMEIEDIDPDGGEKAQKSNSGQLSSSPLRAKGTGDFTSGAANGGANSVGHDSDSFYKRSSKKSGAPSFSEPSFSNKSSASFAESNVESYENGDGYITFDEAYWTYKTGRGKIDLYADINELDLSKISASDFPDGVGSDRVFDFEGEFYVDSDQARVYGRLTLVLLPNNQVYAPGPDTYDFDYDASAPLKRNLGAAFGSMFHGGGTPFKIYVQGVTTINP